MRQDGKEGERKRRQEIKQTEKGRMGGKRESGEVQLFKEEPLREDSIYKDKFNVQLRAKGKRENRIKGRTMKMRKR